MFFALPMMFTVSRAPCHVAWQSEGAAGRLSPTMSMREPTGEKKLIVVQSGPTLAGKVRRDAAFGEYPDPL